MNDLPVDNSINRILESLKSRPEPYITGALLGELIRDIAPELNIRQLVNIPTGPGALTRFIERHLSSNLKKAGRAGSDLLYRISADNEEETHSSYDVWQSFARPGSDQIISLDVSEGLEKATVSVKQFLSVNHLKIEHATHAELDRIRADFTTDFNAAVIDPSKHIDARQPYTEWSKKIKAISPEQYKNWSTYRIEKIVDLFRSRLASFNVPPERIRELEEELKKSQRSIRNQRAELRGVGEKSTTQPMAAGYVDPSIEGFRTALIETIKTMSSSELRELKVPAGAFFDAMQFTKLK